MKTILAIETSCPFLNVALSTHKGKIVEAYSRMPLQHSENLIPLIDKLLKKERITADQIDAFAIDRGPGSFTGLRIGFSLLKGFLAVRKKPCYGALSLDMIAANVELDEGSRLGVLIDARRDAIYSRFYRRQREEWIAEGRSKLLSLPELKDQIREGIALVGDALTRYQDTLREAFGNRIYFLSERNWFPSAATLIRWFQAKDRRLSLLKSPRECVPLYFRASEAEENRRKFVARAC